MDNITDLNFGYRHTITASTNSTGGCQSQLLFKVFSPCILLLGGFGNVATIFVMRRIKDHNSTQHIILTALAVFDFFVLYIGLLNLSVTYFFNVDVRDLHTVLCKAIVWLTCSSSTVSAWLLTAVTVQRTMAVTYPHQMRMVCSLRRTWIVITAIVVMAFTVEFHNVLGMDISQENACYLDSTWYVKFSAVWVWVDMCLTCLIPTICLLVCNVILSLTLFKAVSTTTTTMAVNGNSGFNIRRIKNSRRKTASRTTVMIVALSCTFLVLTLPLHVCGIWKTYTNYSNYMDLYNTKPSSDNLIITVASLMFCSNSAVNFLLYCFTGTKFRKEFLKWICCRREHHSIIPAD